MVGGRAAEGWVVATADDDGGLGGVGSGGLGGGDSGGLAGLGGVGDGCGGLGQGGGGELLANAVVLAS